LIKAESLKSSSVLHSRLTKSLTQSLSRLGSPTRGGSPALGGAGQYSFATFNGEDDEDCVNGHDVGERFARSTSGSESNGLRSRNTREELGALLDENHGVAVSSKAGVGDIHARVVDKDY
jgi:hypothetical protein